MPRNIKPRMVTIEVMVLDALRDTGSLKAVTPLLMASTPVKAVQPAL